MSWQVLTAPNRHLLLQLQLQLLRMCTPSLLRTQRSIAKVSAHRPWHSHSKGFGPSNNL
jgi:hypothetical protein